MTLIFKLAIVIACSYISITNIYAQKIIPGEARYALFPALKPSVYPGYAMVNRYSTRPMIKFTMDEAINISFDNEKAKPIIKKAQLNFYSQNLVSSQIIAAPINPASPLLHDDSHVLALLIHTRNSLPLLLKFALYF